MTVATLLLTLTLPLLPTTTDDAPEWGGFRGNGGGGTTDAKGLPADLDPEENRLWRTDLPGGYSSPVVVGERVFVTASENTELLTYCLDRYTGEVLWKQSLAYEGGRPGANSPASPTPVTDGEHVYVVFHYVGVIAYDMEGKEAWRQEIGPFNIPHGMATSPLLHEDLVVLQVDQDLDAYVVAYDKATGKERWKTERPGTTHSYATPTIHVPSQGPAQLIVSGSLKISSYDVSNGELLWWTTGSAWQTMSMPVMSGDTCIVNAYMVPSSEFGFPRLTQTFTEALEEKDADKDGKISKEEFPHEALHQAWFIFDLDEDGQLDEREWDFLKLTGSATGAMFAIRTDGKGDVTDTHVDWTYTKRRGLPGAPSPLVVDDTIYLIKEGGLLTTMEASTGEVLKQGRVGDPDQYWASPVAADGKIILASLGGQIAVVTGGREWEVASVQDLGSAIWSTPAIAGEQVFVRTQDALYCFVDLSEE